MNTAVKIREKISISKDEYLRLKQINERFRNFWIYLEHLMDIQEARKEIRQKKTIPQEKLFKKLGF
ncbi:MAG: hypothetical protein HYV52_00740 [Parcubacteria group bacterium]|nr:hypothetical protein [Parcubacteria group bacterium]